MCSWKIKTNIQNSTSPNQWATKDRELVKKLGTILENKVFQKSQIKYSNASTHLIFFQMSTQLLEGINVIHKGEVSLGEVVCDKGAKRQST